MGLFNKKQDRTELQPKTVKLAGKKVHLLYCYATEINFYDAAGIELKDFIQEAVVNKTSDPKYVVYAILAAALAYSKSKDEEPQITSEDLIFKASNEELSAALVEVTKLFAEWYHLPAGEQPKNEEGQQGKN